MWNRRTLWILVVLALSESGCRNLRTPPPYPTPYPGDFGPGGPSYPAPQPYPNPGMNHGGGAPGPGPRPGVNPNGPIGRRMPGGPNGPIGRRMPGGPNGSGPRGPVPGGQPGRPVTPPGPSQFSPTQTGRFGEILDGAVRSVGGQSAQGYRDPRICQLAEQHAQRMANRGSIGHDGFNARASAMRASGASEIVATSYPRANGAAQASAADCVDGWKRSGGHRPDLMRYHRRYCYAMAPGRGGRFYCIGLFAN